MTLGKLPVKWNQFVGHKIWTIASLTCKQKKLSANVLFWNNFLSKSNFCMITQYFFHPLFLKMSGNFLLYVNIAKCRHAFLVLWVWKEEQIKSAKNKITWTYSFQKMVRILTFRGHKIYKNNLYFKILCLVQKLAL